MSREMSEHDGVSQFGENKKQLTVQRTDSSISNGSTQAENSHCYAVLLCVIKWFIAIFLWAVVLCCVVASKICLLVLGQHYDCLLYTSPSPRDLSTSRMPSSA